MNERNSNRRWSTHFAFAISITVVLVGCAERTAPSQLKERAPRNTFMVFGNTYVASPQVAEASLLASINKAVEDADIDFVIIVGEVTLGATTEQLEAVKHVMDNSPVRVYVTASNHDLVYANGDWKSGEHDDYARFR